jgi:hypothetical protein
MQWLLCFGIALCARAPAAAQPGLLEWQAPPSCERRAAVELKIRQFLGKEPAVPLRAQVRIERVRGRYHLRLVLELGTHRAERTLHATNCDELSDTVAWLIALAINPQLEPSSNEAQVRASTAQEVRAEAETEAATPGGDVARASPPSSSELQQDGVNSEGKAQATRSTDAVKPSAPEASQQAAHESESAQEGHGRLSIVSKSSASEHKRVLRAGANAGVFTGGPSGAQAALGAFIGLSLSWSHTQARFSGLLPRQVDIAPSASANIWSLMFDLTQCALWGQKVRAGPCLTLAGLRTMAEVRGISQPTHQAALWANTAAGLQFFWRIAHHLELSLSVGAGIPISPRPRFSVQGLGPVVAAKAWSSDARLGLSFASN